MATGMCTILAATKLEPQTETQQDRGHLILLVGLAAATAGIVAVSAVMIWRRRKVHDDGVNASLRGVQEVLSECYVKIRDIEDHILEANKTS